jgi:hypothetical protein
MIGEARSEVRSSRTVSSYSSRTKRWITTRPAKRPAAGTRLPRSGLWLHPARMRLRFTIFLGWNPTVARRRIPLGGNA